MPTFKDLTGKKFSKLTVLNLSKQKIGNKTYWDCLCECGAKKSIRGDFLASASTISCGCQRIIANKTTKAKHGHSRQGEVTRAYRIWYSMKQRCNNKTHESYHKYGGRGIEVCSRWSDSFVLFLEDMGEPPENMSIDRINVNGNYEPGNCRWATSIEQSRNCRNTITLTYQGETKPLALWAEEKGLKYITVYSRYSKGWSVERILS